jgi:putative peptidoglycan lipid II flippase
VLVLTQCLNLLLVPHLAHAGLALAIGLGAMVNATWLLVGLIMRGSYKPAPGWGRFGLQVLGASTLLAVYLTWLASSIDWMGFDGHGLQRVGLITLCIGGAAVVYFLALILAGVKLRQFARK